MLENFKDTPVNFLKTCFFNFDKNKCTWPKKCNNINVNVFFLHIVEVLNVLNLCGGHSYQCIHYFGCKRVVNSVIFCTFLQGWLVKNKKQPQYIPYRYIFFNSVSTSKHV